MNRTIVLLSVIAFCVVLRAGAQEDPEYQKWLKQQQAEYKEYVDKHDREFAEFLKREWRGVELQRGVKPDSIPKPVKMPVFTPPVKDTITPPPSPPTVLPKAPVVKPEPKPVVTPPAGKPTGSVEYEVSFFDVPVKLWCDRELAVPLKGALGKASISDYWEGLSRANTRDVVAQLQTYRSALKLNDWGFTQLCFQTGRKVFGGDYNRAVLFTWYLLTHAGYDARVGYSDGRVHLLITVGSRLFNTPYFTFGQAGARYYDVQLDPSVRPQMGEINTYEGSFPNAVKPTDFSIKEAPNLGDRSGQRTLTFRHGWERFSVNVSTDKGVVDFLRHYPQADYPVFFSSRPSSAVEQSLVASLAPLLKGKSEKEGVNILLHFTQTAFEYKTDDQQFNREKPLFPDETVFYPFSDCEDRAILFAYLVRKLTNLEVVGLNYPAHIATAVRFHEEVRGEAIVYNGSRYVICDPTYVNADAGACMPDFKAVVPSVIVWHNAP